MCVPRGELVVLGADGAETAAAVAPPLELDQAGHVAELVAEVARLRARLADWELWSAHHVCADNVSAWW